MKDSQMIRKEVLSPKDYILKNSIPEPNSGCWLWLGTVANGYRKVFGYEPYYKLAHRLSYFAFGGFIEKDLVVRHLCHNKLCVNPDHLKPGTAKENCDDNKRKWT